MHVRIEDINNNLIWCQTFNNGEIILAIIDFL